MSIKRRRYNPESKSIVTSAPAPVQRVELFGPPLLLQGEDAAAYGALVAGICAAVKPVDIIEEILVDDLVFLEWEVLRWRRLKSTLIRAHGLVALQRFLRGELSYDLYAQDFAQCLAETLRDNLAEDQNEDFEKLARRSARNEPAADDKVNALLDTVGLRMDDILSRAQANRAEKLAQGYARRQPQAVVQVNELLDSAGRTMDALLAEAIAVKLDDIERIDRLTTIAETRRNASLREIDRRRAVLGEALRRRVQEVEDGEFEEIEMTPAKGKSAA